MKQYEVTLRSGKKIVGNEFEIAEKLDIMVSTLTVYARAFKRGSTAKTRRIVNIIEYESKEHIPRTERCDEDCFNCKFPDCIWTAKANRVHKESKLKPCPCCGAEAKLDVLLGKKYKHYRIACTQTEMCGLSQRMFDTEEEAVRSWNRRAYERQAD